MASPIRRHELFRCLVQGEVQNDPGDVHEQRYWIRPASNWAPASLRIVTHARLTLCQSREIDDVRACMPDVTSQGQPESSSAGLSTTTQERSCL